ncbi:MAG: tRNA (adenosine(37)-N6)-threonylcarbamoyltransferase complex dimerization subunit type 1 TsaB [Oscillospiraceae bacterium]|nr:tRNA (adenosine(37)-N6)-threonylcarbamoyltransferase complex dimerization subunit type 1 TsaB [Oscillospiraceae bacterium]
MKILALDTSGQAVSAAVAEDGQILSHIWLRHGRAHAEALMPCVDAALSGLGLDIGAMGAFAVITGPGSFTGLRIGIATAKAFAYAGKTGVAGIPTLDALARNLAGGGDALICPVMDARNGNVYQAIYRAYGRGGECVARVAPTMLLGMGAAADRLMAALKADEGVNGEAFERAQEGAFGGTFGGACGRARRVVLNGDAAATCAGPFEEALGGFPCVVAPERDMHQNAASAALLACEAVERGLLVSPEAIAPEYHNVGYAAAKPSR